MTRPLAVIGFSFFITLLFLNFACGQYTPVVFALCIILFVLALTQKRIRQAIVVPTALLSAATACLLFFAFTTFSYEPALKFTGDNVDVRATVLSKSASAEDGKYIYTLKTQSIGGLEKSVRIKLSIKEELDVDYYDSVQFNGCIYELGASGDEYQRYYKSQKMYLGAYTFSGVSVIKAQSRPIYYYILLEKQKILDIITDIIPGDNGGLLAALLFGDKTLLSDSCLESLRKAGISHLMAVSGLHLSAWALVIMKILEKFNVKQRKRAIICALIVFLVMAFSAFSTSVMRSGMTMLLYLSGMFLSRKPEGFNSLGFAALCLMLFNPYVVCDVSFLLTVSAALGVLFVSTYVLPKIKVMIKSKVNGRPADALNYFCTLVALSVFAQAFTAPVTILFFGTFSLYSLITNVLVSLPSVLCMFGAGLLPVIRFVSPVRTAASYILKALTSYVIGTADIISKAPYGVLNADYIYVYVWLAISIVTVGLTAALSKKKFASVSVAVSLSFVFLICSCAVYSHIDNNRVSVSALDVGNGTAVMVSHDGEAFLIGCGGEYFTANAIEAAADRENVSIDCVLLPRATKYEASALRDILENHRVRLITSQLSELTQNTEFTYIPKLDMTFWDVVNVRYESDNGYMTLTVYDTEFIINLYYESKLGNDIDRISPGILITRKSMPKGVSADMFSSVIVMSDYKKTDNFDPSFYVTGRDSDIVLRVKKDKITLSKV